MKAVLKFNKSVQDFIIKHFFFCNPNELKLTLNGASILQTKKKIVEQHPVC